MSEQEERHIFSKNLRYFVSTQEKNQKEIADAIGVSPQTFNTWYQGIALPRMAKVEKLARFFGISKSDLLEERALLDKTVADSARLLIQIKNSPELMQLNRDFIQLSGSHQQSVLNLVHSLLPNELP